MALDQGPASGNAEFFFGNTAALEIHAGNPSSGLNPQPPSETVIPIDPGIGTTVQTQMRQSFFFGSTAGTKIVNPA